MTQSRTQATFAGVMMGTNANGLLLMFRNKLEPRFICCICVFVCVRAASTRWQAGTERLCFFRRSLAQMASGENWIQPTVRGQAVADLSAASQGTTGWVRMLIAARDFTNRIVSPVYCGKSTIEGLVASRIIFND